MPRIKVYARLLFGVLISYYIRINFLPKLIWFVLQGEKSNYKNPSGKLPLELDLIKISNLKNLLYASLNDSVLTKLLVNTPADKVFKNCILIIPENFLNENTHVGKGFFGVVNSLILMLNKNFLNVEIVQIKVGLDKDVGLDRILKIKELIKQKKYQENNTFFILFSSTYLTQECDITELVKYITENRIYCIGYLTSSGTNPLATLESVNKLKCLNLLVDYNSNSEFIKIKDNDLPVIHIPWIPTEKYILNNNSTLNIAFSGLLKHNRDRWLIAISSLAKFYRIKISIKLYSSFAIKYRLQKFLTREDLLNWFSSYSFGLVILGRSPGTNDGLIGSFWDVFYSGTIPLVQFEGSNYFLAEYLSPFVDYLPFTTIEDLALILAVLRESPDIVRMLKSRNSSRRDLDLNIKNLGIFFANSINEYGGKNNEN